MLLVGHDSPGIEREAAPAPVIKRKGAPESAPLFRVSNRPPQGVYGSRRKLSPTPASSPLTYRSLTIVAETPPDGNTSNVGNQSH